MEHMDWSVNHSNTTTSTAWRCGWIEKVKLSDNIEIPTLDADIWVHLIDNTWWWAPVSWQARLFVPQNHLDMSP